MIKQQLIDKKKHLLLACMLIVGTVSQPALAATVLIGVFDGNDGINIDGSTQLEELAGLTVDVNQLERVNWNFSEPLVNPQTSGDLAITGTVFNVDSDFTEATEGTWAYTGSGTIYYLTVKFDGHLALYHITEGDTEGIWSTADICSNDSQYCSVTGNPFALSHAAAYTVVPVPAAAWLFGSGLLGLISLSRKPNKA